MIGALKGKVIFQGGNFVIIAVNEVGYKVYVGQPDRFLLEKATSVVTHHHITETANDLYGFADYRELQFFDELLQVPGIGPKLAMVITTAQPLEKLEQSIVDSDTSLLQSIQGVGGKLASKIIVELRPKLAKGPADIAALGREDQDLVEALGKLGWRRQEVSSVIRQVGQGDLNERLKLALKLLGG